MRRIRVPAEQIAPRLGFGLMHFPITLPGQSRWLAMIAAAILGPSTAIAPNAWARARFATRDKMIAESDLIAIVDVTEIKELEPEKSCGNAEATANIRSALRGWAGTQVTFAAPCFYPCAVAKIAKGPQLVFLKSGASAQERWIGSNWQYSYRPIRDDAVEWFASSNSLSVTSVPLEKVVGEVRGVLASQGIACAEPPASVPAKAPTTFTDIKKAFLSCDGYTVDRLSKTGFDSLALEQRNELALIAAERLESSGASGYADFLQMVSQKRLITDARVVPYLIKALGGPDPVFVGRPVYYSLTALTRRHSGDDFWAKGLNNPQQRAAVLGWWREWQDANKDKHPIFDKSLERRVGAETDRLSELIESRVKPKFGELSGYSVRSLVPHPSSPIFEYEYDPALMANLATSKVPGDIWISIQAAFATEDLAADRDGWSSEKKSPRHDLPSGIEEVFAEVIPETDVKITVRIATKNKELIAAFRDSLRK